MDELDDLI